MKKLLLLIPILLMTGCATTPINQDDGYKLTETNTISMQELVKRTECLDNGMAWNSVTKTCIKTGSSEEIERYRQEGRLDMASSTNAVLIKGYDDGKIVKVLRGNGGQVVFVPIYMCPQITAVTSTSSSVK